MSKAIRFELPSKSDGMAIYQLVKSCPPLDLNSSYLYFLQATHFAETCVLARQDAEILGFVSGYIHPQEPNTLFIWQVAVAEAARGQGLAKQLLLNLIQRDNLTQINKVITTISPSNKASQGVFTSFANQYGLTVQTEEFLTEMDFISSDSDQNQDHEAEELYSIFKPDHSPLALSITL